jgi:quercetin dioxygenase-like cupin family protein
MIEKIYKLTQGNEKTIEKVIADENLHYNHMILGKNEGLPVHFSNSVVYMTVLRGTLSIELDAQEMNRYETGTILKIPFNTKMNVVNQDDDVLEITVIKAPAPTN